MGGLIGYLTAEATNAIKRTATVYGLMALSGLMAIFAAGYALTAFYAWLMFRYGPITASLIIAGGLLSVAVALIFAARFIASHWKGPNDPNVHAPYPSQKRARKMAVGAGASGAVTAAAVAAAIVWIKRSSSKR
jgi:hypothetical protein